VAYQLDVDPADVVLFMVVSIDEQFYCLPVAVADGREQIWVVAFFCFLPYISMRDSLAGRTVSECVCLLSLGRLGTSGSESGRLARIMGVSRDGYFGVALR